MNKNLIPTSIDISNVNRVEDSLPNSISSSSTNPQVLRENLDVFSQSVQAIRTQGPKSSKGVQTNLIENVPGSQSNLAETVPVTSSPSPTLSPSPSLSPSPDVSPSLTSVSLPELQEPVPANLTQNNLTEVVPENPVNVPVVNVQGNLTEVVPENPVNVPVVNVQGNLTEVVPENPVNVPVVNVQDNFAQVVQEVQNQNSEVLYLTAMDKIKAFKESFKADDLILDRFVQKSSFSKKINTSNTTSVTETSDLSNYEQILSSAYNSPITKNFQAFYANKDLIFNRLSSSRSSSEISATTGLGSISGVGSSTSLGNKFFSDSGILGSLGTRTVNESLDSLVDSVKPVVDFAKNNSDLLVAGVNVLKPILIYKGLVAAYDRSVEFGYKGTPIEARYKEHLAKGTPKDKLFFLWVGAPMITGLLCSINNISGASTLTLGFKGRSQPDLSDNTAVGSSLFFMLKNKLPKWNWKWFFFILVFLIVLILKSYNIEIDNIYNILSLYPLILKWFFIVQFILVSLLILYYIITIYIYILFVKHKLEVPSLLPSVILNWLTEVKLFSEIEPKNKVIDYYLKHLLIYLFILGLLTLVYNMV